MTDEERYLPLRARSHAGLIREVQRQRAENERLRAALDKLAKIIWEIKEEEV